MQFHSVPIEIYPDNRLDTKNAARYLGYTRNTLAIMRSRKLGPRFIKLGKVYYYKKDLDDWLAAHRSP